MRERWIVAEVEQSWRSDIVLPRFTVVLEAVVFQMVQMGERVEEVTEVRTEWPSCLVPSRCVYEGGEMEFVPVCPEYC